MLSNKKDAWIKLKEIINNEDYIKIKQLQNLCEKIEDIKLKLELDYKLALVNQSTNINLINEFMYFIGDELIGYMGIVSFGGNVKKLEVNGMVHPDYRRKGIFSTLFNLIIAESERRNSVEILLLSDKMAISGQNFIKKIGATYDHSEYDMYLDYELVPNHNSSNEIKLRKATNIDSTEINKQNAIYFNEENHDYDMDVTIDLGLTFNPEEEEKRGVITYLAIINNEIIGKINLQIYDGTGGIYGFGVLPEYRRKGYGRSILLLAVKMLKEKGARKTMLQVESKNSNALRLYKECGFYETSVMDYYKLVK